MLEFIIIITFAAVAYYVSEKDNKDGELYKILNDKDNH